jgi:hypothetical protein
MHEQPGKRKENLMIDEHGSSRYTAWECTYRVVFIPNRFEDGSPLQLEVSRSPPPGTAKLANSQRQATRSPGTR